MLADTRKYTLSGLEFTNSPAETDGRQTQKRLSSAVPWIFPDALQEQMVPEEALT